jgi:hypothetical protein
MSINASRACHNAAIRIATAATVNTVCVMRRVNSRSDVMPADIFSKKQAGWIVSRRGTRG